MLIAKAIRRWNFECDGVGGGDGGGHCGFDLRKKVRLSKWMVMGDDV